VALDWTGIQSPKQAAAVVGAYIFIGATSIDSYGVVQEVMNATSSTIDTTTSILTVVQLVLGCLVSITLIVLNILKLQPHAAKWIQWFKSLKKWKSGDQERRGK